MQRKRDMTGDWLTQEFEQQRPHLQAVAYRMLGSLSESEDAVQEAWIRLRRTEAAIDNLAGWLTTVVARISLDMLRARSAQREDYVGSWLPEPIVTVDDSLTPEQETLIADSVGLALLVVLETLTPGERLAFVLHDMFAVPFDEIAPIVNRTPAAARQLASRARRAVQGAGATPSGKIDLQEQRTVVDAFLAASRNGDFAALLEVLDPDVVFRIDAGPGTSPGARPPIEGASAVAEQILARGTRLAPFARPALVNGAAGAIVGEPSRPFAVVGFTVSGGRVTAIDLITDPEKLPRFDAR
jgi:RNA polymerase sigma factor (sigma-70 family)